MEDLDRLAEQSGVPLADVTMIAVNTYGLRTDTGDGRARCTIVPDSAPDRRFRSIVATGRPDSPFTLENGRLCYNEQPVARIANVEHDDARLGYFRDRQRVITLNTNARSHCTGCVFCPNTGADASDPRVDTQSDELLDWLRLLCAREDLADLATVDEVNLSTSCFGEEDAAIEHLRFLQSDLAKFGFSGRLGILSSVIRSTRGFNTIHETVGPFALFLTLECVTRRNLWLKESKASLSADEAITTLARARSAGCDAGVNLVIGLDPIDEACEWLDRAAPYLTDFPNLQVFQVHSRYMGSAAVTGDEPVAWMLSARSKLEQVLEPHRERLRPEHWQNYRPLWFTTFCGEELWSPGTAMSLP